MSFIPVDKLIQSQQAEGPASILAIGTANPDYHVYQDDYPDFYFRVTGNDHMTELKQKLTRMCEKTTIRKRHFILTEDLLKENPSSGLCSFDAPTLNFRQDITMEEIPKLGAEAARKAIKEWGQCKSKITHIIVLTTMAAEMPGADVRMIKLLGLNPTIKSIMLYSQACYGGGAALRIAKDIAENNVGARILVVSSESTVGMFRGPSEESISSLIGQAIFGDGAASVIIGSDPEEHVECPIFQIMSASQTIIPDSDRALYGQFREAGLTSFNLSAKVPQIIGDNIKAVLVEAFDPVGISDWNSIFLAAHPGGPKIVDAVEENLGLAKDKLKASRHILREYGNMSSATVLFILDEIRRKSAEENMATTGEGLDWGILLGFGPGLTVEAVILRSIAIP